MIDTLLNNLHTLLGSHPEFNLLWAFLAGVLSSLTPCVYPLIPVTLALFGAAAQTSRRRAFLLSCSYVLGIAVTYTVLGVISAQTGILFGSLLGNPLVVLIICLALILLSLFTLDIVHFDFAYRIQSKASTVGGKGFVGAFLMGSVSGFVAAPCIGPVLVVILGIAAASASLWWGAMLLLSYALGLGLLFLLLGTFSGLAHKLPRSGDWLRAVKILIASALFVVALFLVHSLVPAQFQSLGAVGSGMVHAGTLIVALLFATAGLRRNSKLALLLACVLFSFTFYFAFVSPPPEDTGSETHFVAGTAWRASFDGALREARRRQTLVMLDLFAEWCAACKDFDQKTFPDPEVRRVLMRLVPARLDFTNESPLSAQITEKYSVVGLPTILFLRPDGSEVPDSRITGFVPPAAFISRLERVMR